LISGLTQIPSLVTLSLLSVSQSQPSDDSAAAAEQEPRLDSGISSKLKQLSDHRYSSDADAIGIFIQKP